MNTSSTVNNIEEAPRAVLVILFSLFFVVGSIGNILSLYCLWKSKRNICGSLKFLLALNVGEAVSCLLIVPYQGLTVYQGFKSFQTGYITFNVVSTIASIMIFLITIFKRTVHIVTDLQQKTNNIRMIETFHLF